MALCLATGRAIDRKTVYRSMSRLFGGSSTLSVYGCDRIATGKRYFQQIWQRKKSKIWVPGVPVINCARLRAYRIMIKLKTECIFNRYTTNIGVLVCVSYSDFTWASRRFDHWKHYCFFYVFMLTPNEYFSSITGPFRWFLLTKSPVSWKAFPCHNLFMVTIKCAIIIHQSAIFKNKYNHIK